MTQLTLGPLAFKYPKNMIVFFYIFVVILEFAFIADQLKCFMYTMNVCS